MLAERIEYVASGVTDAATPGVRNPMNGTRRLRAVLFDLDGTLYRQKTMRALMALELAAVALTRPRQAPRILRVLSSFRKAQEALRGRQLDGGAARQAEMAARQTGVTLGQVEAIVQEWMIARPLKHLLRCRAKGLLPLLDFLTERGVKIGVFSDYPPALKLEALGIGGRFSLALCATDDEIGMFKPHPRGFLVASERWQLDPSEVLVVGDRPDADAAGAAAAGMPCAIVGSSRSSQLDDFLIVSSLERLRDVLDHDRR
jgi:HAD superfamily hydrolase (TIGR01549 family)